MPLDFSTPVKFLKRVGERVATGLAERGVHTVEDLLYHLPFRYEDRLHPKPLSHYRAGEMASLTGEILVTTLVRTRNAPIFEMTVAIRPPKADSDEALEGLLRPPPTIASETVKCMWFHGAYLKDKFHPGQRIALYGKLDPSRSGSAPGAAPGTARFKIVQPTFEILPDERSLGSDDAEFTMLEMGRIVPIYESLGGKTPWGAKLTSRWLRRVVWTIFKDLAETNTEASETLPYSFRQRLDLPSRMQALRDLHFPPAGTPLADLQAATTPAHKRLIFEEFWYLELGLELKRRRLRDREGTAFITNDKVREALKQVLPFKPTGAQKRVLGEIVTDMRASRPMRRLLQGDVGSGKTIVAFEAALVAIENGYQAALMAPTEILATQHYLAARKLLADAISPTTGKPYRVTLLTGSLDARGKKEARRRIFTGETDLAIGTHALVEEKVDFANLGLVIVDEQHRFGVQQRFNLMRKPGADGKATEPDVLVMTATPIPRTLALTMYGDLEASVLDELPPGRTPITTRRLSSDRADEAWDFIRKQVAAGRQAYIVYPVIEGAKDDQPELDFAQDDPLAKDSPFRSEAEDSASLAHADADLQKFQAGIDKLLAAHDGYGAADRVLKPRSARVKASLAAISGKAAKRAPAQKQKLRSATEMHEELSNGPLKGLKLGLLHGRMSADDKEVTMARFKRRELDVLVSTTVIEVGVDVPNSTVMVIEHAERFGLAQLHQLRGRVGRGAAKSFCVLMTSPRITPEAEQRLDAMVRTQNGFELAEIDLKQRGPGEFFGTRQAGLPEFRVADLTRDREMLELAKVEAERFVLTPDPTVTEAERQQIWSRLKQQWQRRYGLVEA